MADYSNMKHNDEKITLIGYSTTEGSWNVNKHLYIRLDEYGGSEQSVKVTIDGPRGEVVHNFVVQYEGLL